MNLFFCPATGLAQQVWLGDGQRRPTSVHMRLKVLQKRSSAG